MNKFPQLAVRPVFESAFELHATFAFRLWLCSLIVPRFGETVL